MDFSALVFNFLSSTAPGGQALQALISFVNTQRRDKLTTIGMMKQTNGNWTKAGSTGLRSAAHFFVMEILQFNYAYALRVGNGVRRLPKAAEAKATLILWWKHGFESHRRMFSHDTDSIATAQFAGEQWPE